jgi:predicted Zn-dependent protease DUF2268
MYEGWGTAPGGGSPAPRRRTGWIIGGVVGLVVALCACVIVVLLAPVALLRITGRATLPGGRQVASAPCADAVASDGVPKDATGQFIVQPLYAEALAYASDAQGQPVSQRAQIWAKDVLYPYPPMNDIFTEAVGGVDQWTSTLQTLDPNAFRCVVRDMQSAKVTEKALAVLQKDAKEIPGPQTRAYLVPWYTTTFGGASQEQSLLIPFWEADPLNRLLPRDNLARWPYTEFALDHEYLEVARYDRLGSLGNAYQTLLDNMVTDGLADQFGAHMTGLAPGAVMSPGQEASLWAQFKPTMNDYANPNQHAEMLGDPAHGIPRGAGYQIGDHIVAGYLARHPSVTFNQLAGMDAQTIYEGSGYDG